MQRVLKHVKLGAGILAGLLLLVVVTIYSLSSIRLNRTYPVPPLPRLSIATDSITHSRGKHLANVANCVFCHSEDLGGKIINEDALGTVTGTNLTPGRGGIGRTFTTDDWVRAIRHGIRRDGTSLLVMPSEVLVHMSLEDLSALVSYLQQLPPVDRTLPESSLGFMGRALFASGKTSLLVAEKTAHLTPAPVRTPDDTLALGKYLADISGCRGCHGLNLSGGRVAGPPGTPLTSNLTPAGSIGNWTEGDFVRSLRAGIRPDGAPIDRFMPWEVAGRMTDAELHAIWQYLRSVPPLESGNW